LQPVGKGVGLSKEIAIGVVPICAKLLCKKNGKINKEDNVRSVYLKFSFS